MASWQKRNLGQPRLVTPRGGDEGTSAAAHMYAVHVQCHANAVLTAFSLACRWGTRDDRRVGVQLSAVWGQVAHTRVSAKRVLATFIAAACC